MDGLAALEAARAAGLVVRTDGERLVIRGSSTADVLARALLARKPEVLALLVAEDPAVAWRAEAMRTQLRAAGPLPFLVARPTPLGRGGCLSCGEPLAPAADREAFRCSPCARAAWLVVSARSSQRELAHGHWREPQKEHAA